MKPKDFEVNKKSLNKNFLGIQQLLIISVSGHAIG